MKQLGRMGLLGLVTCLLASGALAERRLALVIGNGAYNNGVVPLRNPVNDAGDLKKALEKQDFEVTLELNANLERMTEQVDAFSRRLGESKAVGLFFYAGHGVQSEGENYLVPVGATVEKAAQLRYRTLPASYVLAGMEEGRKEQVNILILDACRDNPFRSFRSPAGGLATMQSQGGSIIAFAAGAGQKAEDGTGRNGTFTKHLLPQLGRSGLNVVEMFREVRRGVHSETNGKQWPEITEKMLTTFYFTPTVEPPPPPPPERKGYLQVSVNAPGSKATLNGRSVGESWPNQPLNLPDIPVGKNRLKVEATGFEPVEQEIEVKSGGVWTQVAMSLPPEAVVPVTGRDWRDPTTGMEFVKVPEGSFDLGSPEGENGRDGDEGPVQKGLRVKEFWLGKYEVTNGQYRKWKPDHDSGSYEGLSLNGDDQPVVNVAWDEATAYAKWLSEQGHGKFALPTEMQWEYAARGGTKTSRYWGDDPKEACQYANVADLTAKAKWSSWTIHECRDGYEVTAPVHDGKRKPNAFGLYDMLGNVWEWTCSLKEAYGQSEKNYAKCGDGGSVRVGRGGSWYDGPAGVRSAYRDCISPVYRYYYLGFRLSRTGP
ncbi:MAG: SUMF1/EgtB/PvdO family nonheme iron enzyme [Magnetococcales bacterium]|nr:SUMF1/EgtB/PvdO family nonheme iron enzyme [Magnetococcales bacterium]